MRFPAVYGAPWERKSNQALNQSINEFQMCSATNNWPQSTFTPVAYTSNYWFMQGIKWTWAKKMYQQYEEGVSLEMKRTQSKMKHNFENCPHSKYRSPFRLFVMASIHWKADSVDWTILKRRRSIEARFKIKAVGYFCFGFKKWIFLNNGPSIKNWIECKRMSFKITFEFLKMFLFF